MSNFLPTFGGKKLGQKVGTDAKSNFSSNILAKIAGRKLNGFHITGNPPPSQDKMRKPLLAGLFGSGLVNRRGGSTIHR